METRPDLDAGSIVLRPATGPEAQIADTMGQTRWTQLEFDLAYPTTRRIIVADQEIIGSTSAAKISLTEPLSALPPSLEATDLKNLFCACDDGNWLAKTGLSVDRRIEARYRSGRKMKLFHRAGPMWAALWCRRLGLKGYVAGINAGRFDEFSPALDPAAYVQQLEAGSFVDPVLTAHLRFGARPVAVTSKTRPVGVIVRWRR